ncbi:MAG: InlB B-repeat-containing protein, partial [Firmicutes bacterium]|nr:InlB B-repeat-containing protein [Bacillota bacterium]
GEPLSLEWSIAKAELKVIANDKFRDYNQANPSFDVRFEGFVGKDTEKEVITGDFILDCTAEIDSDAGGEYYIFADAGFMADNYYFVFVGGILTISKASLEMPYVADAVLTYNANPQSPDIIGLSSFYTITDNVQTGAGKYTATVTLTQAASVNYTWDDGTSEPLGLPWTIGKAVLTVTANDKSWVYLTADPEFTYTVTGFLGGDTASVILGGFSLWTAALLDSPVKTEGYMLYIKNEDAIAADYDFEFVYANLTIVRASVARPVVTSADFIYDGAARNPAITTSNLYTITGNSETNVGNHFARVILNDTINYEWEDGADEPLSLQWNILKASRTNFVTIGGWVYGDAAKAPSVGFAAENAVVTFYYDNSPAGGFTSSSIPTNAGSYYVRAVIGETANYSAFTTNSVSFTIDKALLTVRAPDGQRIYGMDNADFGEPSIQGFIGNDNKGNAIIGSFSVFSEANALSPVGLYAIKVSAVSAISANYAFILEDGSLTVMVAANIAKPTLDKIVFEYNGFDWQPKLERFNANRVGIVSESVTLAKSAGTYYITLSLADKHNTAWEDDGSTADIVLEWKITRAVLTVTARDAYKTYNDSNPTLTYLITGYLGTDTAAEITGVFKIEAAAETDSSAGVYPITVSAGTAFSQNYDFEFIGALLTVAKAAVTKPSITSSDFIYDGNSKTPSIETNALYGIAGNTGIESGTYNAVVTLLDPGNYEWKDGGSEPYTIDWDIVKANRFHTVTMSGWIHGQTPNAPSVGGNIREEAPVMYFYDTVLDGDFHLATPPDTPGNYYVRAVIGESANFNACITSATAFKIAAVYSIAYHGLNAISNPNPENYNEWSAAINLAAPGERPGYAFAGWFDNAECAGDPVTAIAPDTEGNITLWAKWEIYSFTVVLSIGGTSATLRLTVSAFGYIEKPADPVREGYRFIGWYHGETEWNFEVDTVTDSLVLTARWDKDEEPEEGCGCGSIEAAGGNFGGLLLALGLFVFPILLVPIVKKKQRKAC